MSHRLPSFRRLNVTFRVGAARAVPTRGTKFWLRRQSAVALVGDVTVMLGGDIPINTSLASANAVPTVAGLGRPGKTLWTRARSRASYARRYSLRTSSMAALSSTAGAAADSAAGGVTGC